MFGAKSLTLHASTIAAGVEEVADTSTNDVIALPTDTESYAFDVSSTQLEQASVDRSRHMPQ
eukprot:6865535-Prorocentrum_lima.AAC.1